MSEHIFGRFSVVSFVVFLVEHHVTSLVANESRCVCVCVCVSKAPFHT